MKTSFAVPIFSVTFSSITYTTANISVSSGASFFATERGVVWSYTSTLPTIADNKIIMATSSSVSTWSMANNGPFTPGTKVYVRAYYTVSGSTFYGAGTAKTFTTTALQGTGAVYDFESASATYSGFNTNTLTATDTVAAASIAMQAVSYTNGVFRASDYYAASTDRVGSEALYFGTGGGETQVTYSLPGRTFDVNSFFFTNQTIGGGTYYITSNKGSITLTYLDEDPVGTKTFVDIANSANASYFKGIDSFTVTELSGTGGYYEMDHLVMQNISSAIILPVRLTSFAGYMQNQRTYLSWNTANETNTKQMQVERSLDGKNFTTASTIAAKGNGNNQYHFDEAINSNEQKIYYRIKTIDLNGNTSLSNVIILTAATITDKDIQLYPNPVNGNNINVSGAATQGNIIIYNLHGEKLKQQIWKAGQQINIKGLAKGTYILQLANDKQVLNSRFVKE